MADPHRPFFDSRMLRRAVAALLVVWIVVAMLAALGELQLLAAATLVLAQESHHTLADLAARGDLPPDPPSPTSVQEPACG